jgi:2,5-diketo-D-gluconate reductase A
MQTQAPKTSLRDGSQIPSIGFGVFLIPNSEVVSAVSTALACGYRHLDTASIYNNEEGVGKAVRLSNLPRKDIFITTKIWNDDQGAGKTKAACLASLEKLGLDYVDLVLIHWPVPGRGLYVDTWRDLIDLRDNGQIKSIGVSNFNPDHLETIIQATGVVPVVNQIECHPWLQQTSLRKFHTSLGIITQSWSPLGRGKLLNEPIIKAIATKHDSTEAQIIIAWHLKIGNVVIPKSITPSRILENYQASKINLDSDDVAQILKLDAGIRVGPDPLQFK